ncbi:MAG TPA: hypothetical protein VM282_13290, partial [Acidimicrobiales bacterium]|nr:hypothetical protein [Acidimicrobiales bacterium]
SPSTARSRRFAMSISSTTDELNMQMIVQVFDRRHNRKPNKTKEIRRAPPHRNGEAVDVEQ